LEDYSLSVLVNAVRAQIAADQGDVKEATEALDAAEARLGLLTNAFTVRSIQARLAMIHAYLGLGDARSAAAVLLEARDLLASTSGFDDAHAEVEELSAKVDSMHGTWVETVHFTPAELRLFPLLATQLSYKEIGNDLFLSIHTIKAEVTSIFRKLGVSSRTQAIDRAREVGLLPSARD
jgi:LuxR family transcriptional regulator, maltose regulon positive regulatory protein